jgi:hypothetical protein
MECPELAEHIESRQVSLGNRAYGYRKAAISSIWRFVKLAASVFPPGKHRK